MSEYADKIANDPYYRRQAKELTNLLFDKGFLADNLTREAVDWLEEYLAFFIGSKCDISVKSAMLLKGIRNKEALRKESP